MQPLAGLARASIERTQRQRERPSLSLNAEQSDAHARESLQIQLNGFYTNALTDPDWKVLPWKFFGVLVVHGMLIGFLGRQSEVLGIVASVISSLLLPATLMVLIQSFSLRAALSPFELLATMTAIGAQYSAMSARWRSADLPLWRA